MDVIPMKKDINSNYQMAVNNAIKNAQVIIPINPN